MVYHEFGYNAETNEGLKYNWKIDDESSLAILRGRSPLVKAESEELLGLGSVARLERAIVRGCGSYLADPYVEVIYAKVRVYSGDASYEVILDKERGLFDYTDGLVSDRNLSALRSHIETLVGAWFRPRIPTVFQ